MLNINIDGADIYMMILESIMYIHYCPFKTICYNICLHILKSYKHNILNKLVLFGLSIFKIKS